MKTRLFRSARSITSGLMASGMVLAVNGLAGVALATLMFLPLQAYGGASGKGGKAPEEAVAVDDPAVLTTPWTFIGEAGGSSDSFLFGGEVLAPVYATADSVVFLYPRFSGVDSDAQIYSIGLGARFLLPGDVGVLGGNVFYDHAEYSGLPSLGQVGFGLEFLGHWLEARANGYLSVSGEKLLDRQRQRDRSTTTSTSRSVSYGDPFAVDHRIAQMQRITTRTTRTTVTETRFFDRNIQGMDGLDFEGGSGFRPDMIRFSSAFWPDFTTTATHMDPTLRASRGARRRVCGIGCIWTWHTTMTRRSWAGTGMPVFA